MMESVLGFIILKFILWIFPSRKIEDVSVAEGEEEEEEGSCVIISCMNNNRTPVSCVIISCMNNNRTSCLMLDDLFHIA